jgi:hypothetical protein
MERLILPAVAIGFALIVNAVGEELTVLVPLLIDWLLGV